MSVRIVAAFLLIYAGSLPAMAQSVEPPSLAENVSLDYSSGNPAVSAARLSAPSSSSLTDNEGFSSVRLRLPEPRYMIQEQEVIRSPIIGSLAVFRDVDPIDGQEGFQLGTTLTRGAATAGISLRYVGAENDLSQSDLFIDFALNDSIRVGIMGTISADGSELAEDGQLGLNAAYSTKSGSFLQGSIADAPTSDPVFGLAIGLRF